MYTKCHFIRVIIGIQYINKKPFLFMEKKHNRYLIGEAQSEECPYTNLFSLSCRIFLLILTKSHKCFWATWLARHQDTFIKIITSLVAMQLSCFTSQRNIAYWCLASNAHWAIHLLVDHLQILENRSYWDHQSATWLQLVNQWLRNLRCSSTNMNGIIGCQIWPSLSSICSQQIHQSNAFFSPSKKVTI